MAIRDIGPIKADSDLRKSIPTIREKENNRNITGDRWIYSQIITGTATTNVELDDGTPTSLTITNTSTDAVDQTITLSLKQTVGGSNVFDILHRTPLPYGATIVLGRDELAFNSANYRISVTLAATSGTASVDLVFRI